MAPAPRPLRYTGLWRAVPRFTPLGMWAALAASPLVVAAVAAPRRAADNRRPGSTRPKSAAAQQAAAADPAGTAKMFVACGCVRTRPYLTVLPPAADAVRTSGEPPLGLSATAPAGRLGNRAADSCPDRWAHQPHAAASLLSARCPRRDAASVSSPPRPSSQPLRSGPKPGCLPGTRPCEPPPVKVTARTCCAGQRFPAGTGCRRPPAVRRPPVPCLESVADIRTGRRRWPDRRPFVAGAWPDTTGHPCPAPTPADRHGGAPR